MSWQKGSCSAPTNILIYSSVVHFEDFLIFWHPFKRSSLLDRDASGPRLWTEMFLHQLPDGIGAHLLFILLRFANPALTQMILIFRFKAVRNYKGVMNSWTCSSSKICRFNEQVCLTVAWIYLKMRPWALGSWWKNQHRNKDVNVFVLPGVVVPKEAEIL